MTYNKETLKEAIVQKLRLNYGCTEQQATDGEMMKACAMVLRDIMAEHGVQTREETAHEGKRKVHYLSLEFLMGRSLMKNAFNLALLEPLTAAIGELGFKAADIFDMEPDAGLGQRRRGAAEGRLKGARLAVGQHEGTRLARREPLRRQVRSAPLHQLFKEEIHRAVRAVRQEPCGPTVGADFLSARGRSPLYRTKNPVGCPFPAGFFQHNTLSGKFRQVYRYRSASSIVSNSPPSTSLGLAAMVDLSNGMPFSLRHSSTCSAMSLA